MDMPSLVTGLYNLRKEREHGPELSPARNHRNYEDTAVTRAFELIRDWGIYTLAGKDCPNPLNGVVPSDWFERFRTKQTGGI
jgi:hypothetical protein